MRRKGGRERVACKNHGRQDAVRQSKQQRALTRSRAECRPSGSSCSDTRSDRPLRWCRCTPQACAWRRPARGHWGCGNQWRECQRRARPSWGWDLLRWVRGRGYMQKKIFKDAGGREGGTHPLRLPRRPGEAGQSRWSSPRCTSPAGLCPHPWSRSPSQRKCCRCCFACSWRGNMSEWVTFARTSQEGFSLVQSCTVRQFLLHLQTKKTSCAKRNMYPLARNIIISMAYSKVCEYAYL